MPHCKANGIELFYDSFGDPEAPPLLLLMGLGCQMVLWAPEFCEGLARRGYHVIRFDHRDLGQSTKLEHLGRPSLLSFAALARLGLAVPPYTLEDMARDTLGLLDHLGLERAHLVGGSMGGMIAQHMAILAPERVRSLCLWMTSMQHRPLPPPHPRVLLRLLQPMTGEREKDIALGVARLRALHSASLPFDEALTVELVTRAWDRDHSPGGYLRQMAAILAAKSRAAALSRLRVPTLVMHGKEDPMIPAFHARETAKTIPGAALKLIDGLGHDYPAALWPTFIDAIAENARRGA